MSKYFAKWDKIVKLRASAGHKYLIFYKNKLKYKNKIPCDFFYFNMQNNKLHMKYFNEKLLLATRTRCGSVFLQRACLL